MEFYRPFPVRTDSEGRVHIVDLDTGRETVVNADFSSTRTGISTREGSTSRYRSARKGDTC